MYDIWSSYLKIDKFFSEDKNKKFLDFCDENNKLYLSEITDELLKNYLSLQGIGLNKMMNIKSKLKHLKQRFYKQTTYTNLMKTPLNKIVFNIPIIKDITIGEFLNYSPDKIESLNLTRIQLETLFEICTTTLPISEILKLIKESFSEEELQFLKDRLVLRKTLEEIGSNKNLSRERVRQIERKLKSSLTHLLKNTNFNISLKIESGFKDEIDLNELNNLISDEFGFLIEFLKKNEVFSRPFYIDFLELFLFDKRERFFSIFHSFDFTNILTTSNVNTLKEKYSIFPWITQTEIEKIIVKLGYEKHGKYYIQHTGYRDIIELYFVKLVKVPLRIDENSIISIIQDINSRLDYNLYQFEIENSMENLELHLARRLEGLISRIDDIVMTDSRTYLHISKIKYDVNKFLELKDKIVSQNTDYIDTISIYRALKDELNSIGIYSDYIFYSLFKYHFSQELNLTPNGNSRVLTAEGKEFNRVEELEQFLQNENKVLEKNYIQEKLNYSNISLSNAIENSNNIIIFDRSYVGLINLVEITEKEIENFKQIVLQNTNENVIFIPNLIGKLNIDKRFKSFVTNNNINKYLISSLIKYYFPEYKGNTNFLVKK